MNTNLDLQTDKIPNKNDNLESNHGLSESTAIDWRYKRKNPKKREKTHTFNYLNENTSFRATICFQHCI